MFPDSNGPFRERRQVKAVTRDSELQREGRPSRTNTSDISGVFVIPSFLTTVSSILIRGGGFL